MFKKLDNFITWRSWLKLCGWSAVIGWGLTAAYYIWLFKGDDIKNFFSEKKAKLFKKIA